MLPAIAILWRIITEFREYEPQPVTLVTFWKWLRQFPHQSRKPVLALLRSVIFISKKQTEEFLAKGNTEIISRLNADGLGPENIIYVALDSAGSSSGVMLNLIRDRQNMEKRGARFLHTRDGDLMAEYVSQLGSGAVVYVDDFSGSGTQFMNNRKLIAPYVGPFAEFFLVACICEEGNELLEKAGVISIAGLVHLKRDRPLHNSSTLLSTAVKQDLIDLSREMYPPAGLGFKRMAANVVLARNSPNNAPLLLRGSVGQKPFRGILPRWDDLEVP